MSKSCHLISVNKLYAIKHSHLATIERQQILYRMSLKNPLYRIVDDYELYLLLNKASNTFHFTKLEISALSILLESLELTVASNPKQLVMFASFVIKACFSDKKSFSFYEKCMKRRYKHFVKRFVNWITLYSVRTEFPVQEICSKYRELAAGNAIISVREMNKFENKINQMLSRNFTGVSKSKTFIDFKAIGDQMRDSEKSFFDGMCLDNILM